MYDLMLWTGLALLVFLLVAIVPALFFVVDQETVAVVERLGKFSRFASAGFNVKIPFIERISGRLSLRVQQLNVSVETKTEDNVFVKIVVSVQFLVLKEGLYAAFYKLTDANTQIQSYVFDVIRAQVPTLELDAVFVNKDSIANAVRAELSEVMKDFGYSIVKALVTDIDPDAKVKESMNEINEQRRLRMAAQEKGEAEKVLKVKRAEADSESMRLNGIGIAAQRKAIIEGLRDSVEQFKQAVDGVSSREILQVVLTTQYYDMLKEVGANDRSNTILLPQQPTGLAEIGDGLRNAVLTANLAAKGADIASPVLKNES